MIEPWQTSLSAAGFPTDALVFDFETYFDRDYSLKKLSTVEFVMDPRFEVTGLGYWASSPATWGSEYGFGFSTPDKIDRDLGMFKLTHGPNLERCTVVVANGKFDCLVLRERYGITPRYVVDVQDLGRNLDARDRHAVEHMAVKYGTPNPKGDTMQFSGLHWGEMTPEQRTALTTYCKTDVEIEAHLFKTLLPQIVNPETELRLSDQTLKLFLNPAIRVNTDLGRELIASMEAELSRNVEAVRSHGLLYVEPGKVSKRVSRPPIVRPVTAGGISGDRSFVSLLAAALPPGESVPMKQGKKKQIPALAKTDEALDYLLTHPKPAVRALVEARKATDSWPAHISRVHRIMDQARARGGLTGFPLCYYGGHTGRFSGAMGVNFQNLGARDVHPLVKQVGAMLETPDGYTFGTGDLSQIEARIVAWLAGQSDLVQGFARGEDVYSDLAQNSIFHEETRKPRKDDPPELAAAMKLRRDFGKMCCLACGFGMGANTFYLRCIINKDLKSAFTSGKYSRGFCDKIVSAYRQRYTKIVAYWYEIERAWRFVTKYPAQTAVVSHVGREIRFSHRNKTTIVTLPSGRELYYPGASVNVKGECRYRWGKTYAGSLVENIVQATARDVFTTGLLRIEDAGFVLIGHIHDSATVLLKRDGTEDVRLAEMHRLQTDPILWASGLPVATEGSLSCAFGKG
jgi:DNA polymerase